jgi:hypothetical protein
VVGLGSRARPDGSSGVVLRANANPGVVLESIPNDVQDRCVDLFQRPDGSFGFNEFRKDPEDSGAWTLTHNYSASVYVSREAALAAAQSAVSWLNTAS